MPQLFTKQESQYLGICGYLSLACFITFLSYVIDFEACDGYPCKPIAITHGIVQSTISIRARDDPCSVLAYMKVQLRDGDENKIVHAKTHRPLYYPPGSNMTVYTIRKANQHLQYMDSENYHELKQMKDFALAYLLISLCLFVIPILYFVAKKWKRPRRYSLSTYGEPTPTPIVAEGNSLRELEMESKV
jgi:hypothetical protein